MYNNTTTVNVDIYIYIYRCIYFGIRKAYIANIQLTDKYIYRLCPCNQHQG